MKIIPNPIIPFKGYIAINLFGVLFVRKELVDKVKSTTLNHEAIHSAQMKELWYIPFYIIYFLEYILKFFRYWNFRKAYRNISFEREAYANEKNFDYLLNRKKFAQWKR